MIKRFFDKYVDPKKLVTGLIQAAIIGLFVLAWNNFSQLKDTLGPVFTFEISVPILPTFILLLVTQYFIHKTLLRFQAKFGSKENDQIDNWLVSTNRSTPQWTAHREIPLNGGLLTDINCSVSLSSDYLRFGFKLLDRNAKLFGHSHIINNDNNGLFHISKEVGSTKIYTTCYINGSSEKGSIYSDEYVNGQSIAVSMKIDASNFLTFSVNGKITYQANIPTTFRERLFLMAWGDRQDYEMQISGISFSVRK